MRVMLSRKMLHLSNTLDLRNLHSVRDTNLIHTIPIIYFNIIDLCKIKEVANIHDETELVATVHNSCFICSTCNASISRSHTKLNRHNIFDIRQSNWKPEAPIWSRHLKLKTRRDTLVLKYAYESYRETRAIRKHVLLSVVTGKPFKRNEQL